MSDDRPITYQESDRTIYRASSLGHCPRQLVLQRQGYDPLPYPESVLKVFDEGNWWEPIMLDHLRANNWSVKGLQEPVELEVLPGRVIRGHLDGTGYHFIKGAKVDGGINGLNYTPGAKGTLVSPKLGIEVKALSHENYYNYHRNGLDAFPAYKWQLSVYMLATGLPFAMVVIDKDKSVDGISWTVHVYTEPPISKADIIRRILLIERHVKASTLPSCEPDSFFCPFTPYHDAKPVELITDNSQIELIRKYNQYSKDIRLLESERKHVKEIILKLFSQSINYSGGGFNWSITQYDKKPYEVSAQTVTTLSVKQDKA